MAGESFLVVFVAVAAIAILGRLAAGSFDRDRIRAYVESRGGTVQGIAWQPFGRGWYGERGDRIYEVRFTDAAGRHQVAHCKTRAFSGVYWTEGSPDVAPADGAGGEVERLRQENRRLRERLGD